MFMEDYSTMVVCEYEDYGDEDRMLKTLRTVTGEGIAYSTNGSRDLPPVYL